MMAKPYLLDGPLMEASDRRLAMLNGMAKALADCGESVERDCDAKRILRERGYPKFEVEALAPEARMLAYQEIVAREVSEP